LERPAPTPIDGLENLIIDSGIHTIQPVSSVQLFKRQWATHASEQAITLQSGMALQQSAGINASIYLTRQCDYVV